MSDQPPLIFVIDTSAIFHRDRFTAENIQLATTSLIEKEMEQKGLKETVALLKATDKLRIIDPTPSALKQVKETAAQLGDLQYLSDPDLHLLALAVDLHAQNLHAVILSDDYSIQNVAQRLSLEFKSASTSGIREVINWETYCSACGHKEPKRTQEKICPICGTALKRRAVHKEQI
ncbi:MAG: NOB1 family endonuclease [Promethearchaeota archaeon]